MRTQIVAITVLCALTTRVQADPELSVVPLGLQSGNWVWRVDVVPDFTLVNPAIGSPLAVELGFRLTGAPLLSAANINSTEFNLANPGLKVFDWQPSCGVGFNNHPCGLQVNEEEGEIFAAFGSVLLTEPGAKPLLEIVAAGPDNGGTRSTTLEWLGAYDGAGLIAQVIPSGAGAFQVSGFVQGAETQMLIPEPASGVLAMFCVALVISSKRSRRR